MFKNRFLLIVGLLAVLLVTMAISRPLSDAPKGSVVLPVTGASEYLDYYQRHPALRLGLPTSAHTILNTSLLDECFDVSLSELAACLAASQSPAP